MSAASHVSAPQKQRLVRWLVGGTTVMVALAIGAALADSKRFFNGMLTGGIFVSTLGIGACIYVALQVRGGNRDGVLLRRPLESLAGALQYCALAYGILIIGQRSTWPMAGILAAFTARASIYVLLLIGIGALVQKAGSEADDTGKRKKLDRLGQRAPMTIAFLVAILVLMSLEWVVGLHKEKGAFWLGPVFAANLLAGGIATAVAVGTLIVAQLDKVGLVGSHANPQQHGYTSRWLVASSVAWFLTAGALAAAIHLAGDGVRAAWQPHATVGVWKTWSIVDIVLHTLPLVILVVSRSRGALVLASVAIVAAQVMACAQMIVPAVRGDALPSWIELGGFAAFVVGAWLMVFQSLSERPLYPYREL